jgi:geranylgeranyl reductase family protein
MKERLDVLIVGAGPAGSSAAIALARRGYATALIDKQRFPREKICGDFINPINWPVFEELGVAGRLFAAAGAHVGRFRITTCSGAAAETALAAAVGPRSGGLALRRALLDQVLVERAVELGAQARLGCRIVDLARTEQGWRVTLGSGITLRARAILGADGRNSRVARRLGLSTGAPAQGPCVGFQARLRSSAVPPGVIEIHIFPGGYAGLVALGDGTVNLGLAVERARLPRHGIEEFLFAGCLPQNPHLRSILRRSERPAEVRSAYPVYVPARRGHAERVLLTGDAVRVTEPISGEGVYFALRSGLLAGEAIDGALRRGDLSANYLRRYEVACARSFRRRTILNGLLRFAVYRPALLEPLIRLSEKNGRALSALVDRVCQRQAVY